MAVSHSDFFVSIYFNFIYMSTNNNHGFGEDTNTTKAWDKMGNPDTKHTGDDKKMGTDPQPKGWGDDTKKL